MSWQTYVDTNLVGTGNVSKAAIIATGNGALWAKSGDFNLSEEEAGNIAKNISNPSSFQAAGAKVEKEKYIFLRAKEDDGPVVYMKKGESGMCIVKCTQCILVGLYNPPIQPGNCNNVVEKLGEYLRNSGY
ncbi:PREDICTED: profilin-1A-like [Branchiostoma belcheri]|uniref:Profilin n=1 Tax=Branchiostoma belcheri TaxID=7741 RepID=A0A6P5ABZ5_BRABE|nr:PREDICTED: profilin-1A-like [Branchiostoma belcheri]XP_019639316.1 PREDICTED: profilin-1A-like [Branchiostoma belcheri]